MVDLNHRYALDGRDPASYGGLLWCLGQFDRPFKPPKDVIGTVRPRPTRDHARRLDPVDYLRKTTRPLLPSMPTVAVIGAGMSGLAAARTLVDHGFDVTVFDKGRGVGGRMSSRRTDTGFRFDHGAQYFTAKDERFRRYVDSWRDFGVIEAWHGRIVELDDQTMTDRGSSNRFVGVPGMNAVCKHLARDVKVVSKTKIDRLERTDRWQLSAGGQSVGSFDFVVVAIPPTQAAELLGSSTPLTKQMAATVVAPCWAAMFAFSDHVDLPADGVFVKNSPISWIARDSSKPSRDMVEDCWVVHASPDWSTKNIELEPDEVRDLLLSEFHKVTNTEPRQPLHAVAHRWRFANPVSHLESGFLLDEANQLAVCGDWCLGNRVEAAFLSGVAAAGAVLRHVLQAEHTAARSK
jgi:predicted NAD/FAD-dependent oxidoreductase